MLPKISIIGRTNVGKSTLFNKLTKSRNAIVYDYHGVTINQNEKNVVIGKYVKIIDTPGFNMSKNIFSIQMQKQLYNIIKKSFLILFLVDVTSGLTNIDQNIYSKIKKHKNKTILIANKIDVKTEEGKITEFYSLGFKNFQKISAEHNVGINSLKKYIKKKLCILNQTKKNINYLKICLKIAVVGCTNVGKSTFINNLSNKKKLIYSDLPGTTRDSISTNIEINNYKYSFIDTAGIQKKKKINFVERISIIKSIESIKKSDVVLFLFDVCKKISRQDIFILNIINKYNKPFMIIANKWDLIKKKNKKYTINNIKNHLKFFNFTYIKFISSVKNIKKIKIIDLIKKIYHNNLCKNIKTSKLNKLMYLAIKKHQPPLINGKTIKLKYITQKKNLVNKKKITIYGVRTKKIPLSYKKYLNNFFQKKLKIIGIKLCIKFKDNINPYIKKSHV
ncbi:ribosome biogenesis GTPase Der [Buchnera aphidicola (Taiwanaphis decaspermi)]|uniref:ribosome biogenesis GTPase Der n=1 Tax=Buchnera aphidicola TaxID=9 RepID=UPI0031B7FC09